MKIRLFLMVPILCFSLLGTGCFSQKLVKEVAASMDKVKSDNNALMSRGNLNTLKIGSTLRTETFNLKVNSATIYKMFEDMDPGDPSWRFLVINVTIKNTYPDASAINLDTTALKLSWDDLEGYTIDPEVSYFQDQLSDYYEKIKVFKKTSRTGNLVYIIPDDADDFQLIHENNGLPFDTAVDTSDDSSDYGEYYSGYDDGGYDDYYTDFYNDYDGGYDDYSSETINSIDIMKTTYFELTVNSGKLIDEYEGRTPDDPNQQFLLVNVSIKNTDTEAAKITLYDYDFEITCDSLSYGIYPEDNAYADQLPGEYHIYNGETRTGILIFLVPKESYGFQLQFYDDTAYYNTSFAVDGEKPL